MIIPEQLARNCREHPERAEWLARLPATLNRLTQRWSLQLGDPWDHPHVSCSWVAAVTRADGTPAVLKLGMPHMEGADEIDGLRFWDGDGIILLLEADHSLGAMLLERCTPGTSLRECAETRQDVVIAGLLKRLWRKSGSSERLNGFRHLSELLAYWSAETLAASEQWPDPGLVEEGLHLFQLLGAPASSDVLLATDLHAGNVLRSEREPWLAIDPKPFVGDRVFDLVQHLDNCELRLHANPLEVVNRLADLAEVDRERLRLWTFARAAADPRSDWTNPLWIDIARALSRAG